MKINDRNAMWWGVATFVIAIGVLLTAIFIWLDNRPVIFPQPDNVNMEVFQERGDIVPATGSATPVEEPNVASPSSTPSN